MTTMTATKGRRTGRRQRATLIATGALVAGLAGPLVAAAPASALSPATPETLELLLDASGSMAGPDPAGGTKIDAARSALAGVLSDLPEGTRVGVRAYGGTYEDRERGCTDTRLLVPVGPADSGAASTALAGLKPTGYTPLASSLRAAAADLPLTGRRTVVLVSDGEETCGGDPCAVARELSGSGVGLTVDTVGYGVDDRTRDQLSCVADATGGTYSEAPDAGALTVQLAQVAGTGLRRYDPSGTRVTGSPELLGAPGLAAGQYVDALDPGERSYYTVDLPDGVTPYLAATLVHPPGPVAGSTLDSLTIALYNPAGTKCGSTYESTSQSSGGTASTVVATPGQVGTKWNGSDFYGTDCGAAGRYTVSVERDDNGKGQAALPLELRVLLEPPPVDRDALPVPPVVVPAALPQPQLTTPLKQVTGGGSFGTATALSSGSWEDHLRQGETVYYRVPVGWGQRIAFTASIPPSQPDSKQPSGYISAFLAGPTRQELPLLDGDTTESYFSGSNDDDGAMVGGSTAAVLYRNRDVKDDDLQTLAVAGDQYLVVHFAASTEPTDVAVPVRLAVSVTGDQTGTPQYGKATGAQDPSKTTTTKTDTDTTTGKGGQAQSSGTSSTSTTLRTVAYTGGGVAALAIAGGLLLVPFLRGRRRSPRT